MKDHLKLFTEYDPCTTHQIVHEWGQNSANLYEQLLALWPGIEIGHRVVITTYKHFGLKGVVRFFKDKGLGVQIVGKGPNNLRVLELTKTREDLPVDSQKNPPVHFATYGREYEAEVGNAIFSKEGLDVGTGVLLEYLLQRKERFVGTCVADFGAGWGALSLVLADQVSDIELVAFEKDLSSYNALRANLKGYPGVEVIQSDLTAPEASLEQRYRGFFTAIVSNPPFHLKTEEKERFFTTAQKMLLPHGALYVVIEKPYMQYFKKTLESMFTLSNEHEDQGYVIQVLKI